MIGPKNVLFSHTINFYRITNITKRIILEEAEKFTEKLNTIQNADKDRINDHIYNIFFEVSLATFRVYPNICIVCFFRPVTAVRTSRMLSNC